MFAARPALHALVRLVPTVGRTVAAGVVLCLGGTAAAQVQTNDQVLPESMPITTGRLVLHMPGTATLWTLPGFQGAVTNAASLESAPVEATGRFLRAQGGKGAGGRLVVSTTLPTYRFLTTVANNLSSDPSENGMTLSVWYRHPKGYPKQKGLNPLVMVGKGDSQSLSTLWQLGLALVDGKPTVHLRDQPDVIGLNSLVSSGKTAFGAIDDGEWHHLALRAGRPGCTFGSCAANTTVLLSLFVDDVLREERLAKVGVDLTKVLVGQLDLSAAEVSTYGSQTNANGAVLNTLADLDDLLVYDGALSQSELGRIRSARKHHLRFQAPQVDGQRSDWSTGTVLVKGYQHTTTQGAIGFTSSPTPIDLLALNRTTSTGTSGAASNVEGLSQHTFAAWASLPSTDGGVAEWRPTGSVTSGWALTRQGQNLRLTCAATQQWVEMFVIGTESLANFRLVSVTQSASELRLSVDLYFTEPLLCLPTAAVGASQLVWQRPNEQRLGWVAVTGDARTPPQVAELASPGPSLWLTGAADPTDLSGFLPPSVIFSNLSGFPVSNDWTTGFTAPGQARHIAAVVGGVTATHLLAGKDSPSNHEASASFELTLTALDPSVSGFPLISRMDTTQGPPYQRDFTIRVANCNAAKGQCQIVVDATPHKGLLTSFTVNKILQVGVTYRIGVAWPYVQTLPLSPGDPKIVYGLVQPLIAIDSQILNQRYSTDPQHIVGNLWGSVTVGPTVPVNTWVLGDVSQTEVPNQTRFQLTHARIYGRAVRDIADNGMHCGVGGAANPSVQRCAEQRRYCSGNGFTLGDLCTSCVAGSYSVGGMMVSPADTDCAPLGLAGEECARGKTCASGRCDNGVCAPKDQADCDAWCGKRGRTCKHTPAAGPVSAAWDCSACLPDFRTEDGTGPYGQLQACYWSPTKSWPETCVRDSECTAGKCEEQAQGSVVTVTSASGAASDVRSDTNGPCKETCTTSYTKVTSTATTSEAKEKRCLATTLNECTSEPTNRLGSATQPFVRPDGSTDVAFHCAAPKVAPSWAPKAPTNCTANYVPENPVLSSGACEVILAKMSQDITGSCNGGNAPGCNNKKFPSAVDSRGKLLASKAKGLTLTELKELVLGAPQGVAYDKNTDFELLLKAGVGPLLIAYVGSPKQQAAMEKEHGAFLPLKACALNEAKLAPPKDPAAFAYHNGANWLQCRPKRQPNGSPCPPAGVDTKSLPNDWCFSGYCARDTHMCARGDNPMQEFKGNGDSKGNKGNGVAFGLVRVDDIDVQIQEDKSGADRARYLADLTQVHVACVLGNPLPPVTTGASGKVEGGGIFATKFHIDKVEDGSFDPLGQKSCSDNTARMFVVGFEIPMPQKANDSPIGGIVQCDDQSKPGTGVTCKQEQFKCTIDPKQVLNDALGSLIPEAKFCVPIADKDGNSLLPEFKKDFKEYLVPLYVTFGPTLDLCISFAFALDETYMPQFEIKPNVGVGIEAKAGIGLAETNAYEFGVGVKLALTIVDVAFPITWLLQLTPAKATDQNGTTLSPVERILNLSLIQKIALELTLLAGEFSFYAELSVGFFSLEWTFRIFSWAGLLLTFDLSEEALLSTKIDFGTKFLGSPKQANTISCDTSYCKKAQ